MLTFISVHILDIICLSETYHYSETSPDDDTLQIPSYNIIRKHHPSNSKYEGVSIYYKKNALPFKLINMKYLQECITFEKRTGRKCSKFICLYRSPSQTNDKVNLMISVLDDFNTKSNNWYKNDITSLEGSMIDAVTSNYGLHQLIQGPTHILNLSSSCIDLRFTSQPSLVMESGVLSCAHPNCHHQLAFEKFNLSILHPPPHEKTVWFYEKANPELIWRAIDELDWIRTLSNVRIDKKVSYFTETLLNKIHNFIPHKRIVCDDKDPSSMNSEIKNLIIERNLAYKSYCRFNRDVFLFDKIKFLQNQLYVSNENFK